jgi:bifunctional DNase/RNase
VLLFYLGGLTYAETAAELGIDVGAVKTRLHKGRATLRRELLSLCTEESMAVNSALTTESRAVEMRVVDVRRTAASDDRPERHVIVLEEVNGAQTLLFWVGAFEGQTTACILEQAEMVRPLTYQFLVSVLQASGGTLKQVRITHLLDETFYAVAAIESAAGVREVDARPSDAVNLALLTGAPIFVGVDVLAAVQAKAPPADIHPDEWNLAGQRGRSAGSAELVAEQRERHPPVRWKPRAE